MGPRASKVHLVAPDCFIFDAVVVQQHDVLVSCDFNRGQIVYCKNIMGVPLEFEAFLRICADLIEYLAFEHILIQEVVDTFVVQLEK